MIGLKQAKLPVIGEGIMNTDEDPDFNLFEIKQKIEIPKMEPEGSLDDLNMILEDDWKSNQDDLDLLQQPRDEDAIASERSVKELSFELKDEMQIEKT
jgi:hypothetical protein